MERALRACAVPGCPELVQKFCPVHPPVTGASSGLYDHAWSEQAKKFLHSHPICAVCGNAKATEVHHGTPVQAGGAVMDRRIWVPICHPCHSVITGQTRRRARPPQRFRRRVR